MEQEERPGISPIARVTVTKMNHLVEVQHMEYMNRQANIRKLDKDTYVNLKTGELGEFKKGEVRSDSFNSLRQTFKNLRYLINNNYTGAGNELFITLTYKENMTDTKRLYSDFDKFMKRFRYKYGKIHGSIDYMTVVEPQERGAWHHHLLVRFNDRKGEKLFIPSNEVAEIWGHGFIRINSLNEVDNIGAYLSAYLADVELTEDNIGVAYREKAEVVPKMVDGQEKAFIKGGRLHLYPSGMNLYRKSRGIKMPERQEMEYGDIKKVVGSAEPNYTKQIVVEKDDFTNTITYEQYNMRRGGQ